MNAKQVALIFVLSALYSPMVTAQSTCNVRAKVPKAALTIAKTSDQSVWQEYRNVGDIPNLEPDGGISVRFWLDRNKNRSVTTLERYLNFWTYTRYCFDNEGKLEGVGFELRTLLDWGYRIDGSVVGGELQTTPKGFFSLKNGKMIPKPSGVSEAPASVKPTPYMKMTDLPFAKLLTVTAHSKRHSRSHKASAQ